MGDSSIRLDIENGVAKVTLDRPERRNALTQAMWQQVIDFAEEIGSNPKARLAVFQSASPGIFSSGADVTEYREHATDLDWSEESQRVVSRALLAVERIPIPTLAAIDGPCFGGGCGIAIACDWRIASARSTFGITPAKLGMVYPYRATVTLVQRLGSGAAMWLLATGAAADAQRALCMGLVDSVFDDPDELIGAIEDYASLMRVTSPGSVRIMKEAITRIVGGQVEPSPETDAWVRIALESADYQEGVLAFLERRTPRFGNDED